MIIKKSKLTPKYWNSNRMKST